MAGGASLRHTVCQFKLEDGFSKGFKDNLKKKTTKQRKHREKINN